MTVWAIVNKSSRQDVDPRCDAVMEHFVNGVGAVKADFKYAKAQEGAMIIRGLKYGSMITWCWDNHRDFYYLDNGYFGNGKKKNVVRLTQNHVQLLGNIIERDNTRIPQDNFKIKPHTCGTKILVCPPSGKVMNLYGLDPDQWLEDTISEIKKHTGRPIEVRVKPIRSVRINEDSFEQALENDVHAVVTHSSVAGVESVMWGKPVFVTAECAASAVANTDLSKLEDPWFPDDDLRWAWLRHLSYGQFTYEEIANGVAWRILNEKN